MSDPDFTAWRDAFLLAFGAAGWGSLCPNYDEGRFFEDRPIQYFNNDWEPIDAMNNELSLWVSDMRWRPIEYGPPR